MSDTKDSETPDVKKNDIDAVDSPELNTDATRDDESDDPREIAEEESEDIQGDEPEVSNEIEEKEEESDDIQDDEPEDSSEVEEKSIPEDDSIKGIDEKSGNEKEKEENNEAEVENEEIQDDEPEDNNDIEEKSTLEGQSARGIDEKTEDEEENNKVAQDDEPKEIDEKKETTEKKNKLLKIRKWAGIVSLPLIATALLFFLKPTVISNLFNTAELQIHTSKTAATQWTAEELEMINVVGQTVTETGKIWNTIFTQKGGIYKKPDFTIFTGRIRSACAEKQENELTIEQSSLGTFYCPDEKRIYIDLSLHRDLKNRLDIPGDFAQGYIVAHEIGHHVQNLAGISAQIPAARLRLSDKEFDMISQRLELQADCFAGIWARHVAEAQYNVRPDEFADTLNAVTHYSQQHLKQKKDTDIMPDPFTHGSPRLRLRWFTIGYEKGSFDACDTFTVMEL